MNNNYYANCLTVEILKLQGLETTLDDLIKGKNCVKSTQGLVSAFQEEILRIKGSVEHYKSFLESTEEIAIIEHTVRCLR